MVAGAKTLNYFNVLESLLSLLPSGGYQADVGAWGKEISALRDQYEDRFPALFAQIHFVQRPPGPPYSRQVSDFFVSQAFGGVKQVMNPSYERMEISSVAKQELESRNPEILEEYREVLIEMASKLSESLGLPREGSEARSV